MADILLPETHYDVIIVGTGMEESILAAALSRAGKRILHLDVHETYGAQYSTLNPNELYEFILNGNNSTNNNNNNSTPRSDDGESSIPLYNPSFSLLKPHLFSNHSFNDSPTYFMNTLNSSLQRRVMIDLCGLHLLYCRGPMVDLLINSGVARNMEFRCLDSIYMFDQEHESNPFKQPIIIYSNNDNANTGHDITDSDQQDDQWKIDCSKLFQMVPTTKGEVFKTKFISLKEKNRLVKFITFCMELPSDLDSSSEETTNTKFKLYKEHENESFELFLKKTQLLGDEENSKLKSIIIHALALLDSANHSQYSIRLVISRVKYFISSLGRFGNGGAFLYPMYGQSELIQVFCRVSAVFGGVYVLRRGIQGHVSMDGDGEDGGWSPICIEWIENEHYEKRLHSSTTTTTAITVAATDIAVPSSNSTTTTTDQSDLTASSATTTVPSSNSTSTTSHHDQNSTVPSIMNHRDDYYSKEKQIIRVQSGVQSFTCDHLIVNRDTLNVHHHHDSSNAKDYHNIKTVIVCDQPLFSSSSNVLAIIPPGTIRIQKTTRSSMNVKDILLSNDDDHFYYEQPFSIYLTQMDYTSCTCPRGKYLITLQTCCCDGSGIMSNNRVVDSLEKNQQQQQLEEELTMLMLEECVKRLFNIRHGVVVSSNSSNSSNSGNSCCSNSSNSGNSSNSSSNIESTKESHREGNATEHSTTTTTTTTTPSTTEPFSMYISYKQHIRSTTHLSEHNHSSSSSSSILYDLMNNKRRIHMCHDASADILQFESGMIEHVKQIFHSIIGHECCEFLPKLPDPNQPSERNEEEEALYDETTKLLGIDKSKIESSTEKNNVSSSDSSISTPTQSGGVSGGSDGVVDGEENSNRVIS